MARVLLTEGSSLTCREVLTCLGPLGHHLEVLDPDNLCLARFSRWTRRVHECPPAGRDPVGYVEFLERTVTEREIDVVLPTHEQGWLLANAGQRLGPRVRIALANPEAFARVQSKVAFAQLLDELSAPQPEWRRVETAADLAGWTYPYWLKAAFGTAGRGVAAVRDDAGRDEALAVLRRDGTMDVMAQRPATGQYGQAQGLFDHGRLIAAHTSVQVGEGMGGSAAARLGVDHPAAREHLARIGAALDWHGGLTLDYLHVDGKPLFIEANPRTVEPGNAAASGVNLPDTQIALTVGRSSETTVIGRPGARTHGTIALLIGLAGRTGSRRVLLRELAGAARRRGRYAGSAEQLTPLRHDPPSVLPLALVATRLLLFPASAERLAAASVDSYSIEADAISALTRWSGTRR